jgi:putative PLP-dependent aminotransferase (TIGR04422 family)
MTQPNFIWPKVKVSRIVYSLHRFVTVDYVESLLREMFPTGYPVLCSSGRAGLTLALIYSSVGRGDLVGVFPYASHCVLDAVARIATPLSGPTAIEATLRVVYHQWGFMQEKDLPPNTIEDCVDTLCIPETVLFPGGGRFEIWSLPKTLGTSSGGILWCRDQDTATQLRKIRDERGGGIIPWLIRLLGKSHLRAHLYWQGAEANMGCMSRFQAAEILHAIKDWDAVVCDRKVKLETIWPYAISSLIKPVNRLPPVVPVEYFLNEEKFYNLDSRMFEFINYKGERCLKRIVPVPIHQDVSMDWLNKLLKKNYE